MAKLPKLAAALAERDTRLSEVLRLSLVEGLSIRAIAKRLKLARKTVRRLLARGPKRKPPPSEPRPSLLDAYDAEIRRLLADTPELTAPGIQLRGVLLCRSVLLRSRGSQRFDRRNVRGSRINRCPGRIANADVVWRRGFRGACASRRLHLAPVTDEPSQEVDAFVERSGVKMW